MTAELMATWEYLRILTMERLNGAALVDLDAIRSITTVQPENVLISALNTWFGSLVGAETFHADVHAGAFMPSFATDPPNDHLLGNLLVLPDGKVGFIDFGIVGRISASTWKAMEAFLVSIGNEDFATMAKALATMGATAENVDIAGLEADLRELFKGFSQLDSNVVLSADPERPPLSLSTSSPDLYPFCRDTSAG